MKIRDRFNRWQQYRRTMAEIDSLSTRDLSDMGVSREHLRAEVRRAL